MAILVALSSTQVIAAEGDDKISGGSRYDSEKGALIVPCVKVNIPGNALDGKYFDVKFMETDTPFNFRVDFGTEETNGVCEAVIEAILAADVDTTDVDGDYYGDEMDDGDSGDGDSGDGDSGDGDSGDGDSGTGGSGGDGSGNVDDLI